MKEIRLYYDSIEKNMIWNDTQQVIPNCMPNDKGLTFGNYGFLITRTTGIKKFNECMQNFKILLTKDRSKKYFYPVEIQGMYTEVFEKLPSVINKDVFKDIQDGKAILCISYIQEGDHHKTFYEDMNKFLDDNSISPDNLVFLTNNPRIKQIDNIFYVSYYLNHMMANYSEHADRLNDIQNLNYNEKRPYYFLSFNRNPKLHRMTLGALLLKNNLLDKGMMSMGYDVDGIDKQNIENYAPSSWNWRTPIYSEEKIKELNIRKHLNDLIDMCPLLIDGEIQEDELVNDWEAGWIKIKPETYNKAYFTISAANSFDTPWIHPDEKLWKPLGQLHPFIWLGPTGGIQHLKDKGFKSFSPFIDESYDTEEDCEKRMMMIVNEIKRLCSMSKQEIHDWYYNDDMQDILIYNQKKMLNCDESPFDELYNKLFNLVK